MAAKKIAKVAKPKLAKPKLAKPEYVAPDLVQEPVQEVAPKTMSEEELIGKFFSNASKDKDTRLLISIGGPSGTVSIERYSADPKLVFSKSLIEAIQKLQ